MRRTKRTALVWSCILLSLILLPLAALADPGPGSSTPNSQSYPFKVEGLPGNQVTVSYVNSKTSAAQVILAPLDLLIRLLPGRGLFDSWAQLSGISAAGDCDGQVITYLPTSGTSMLGNGEIAAMVDPNLVFQSNPAGHVLQNARLTLRQVNPGSCRDLTALSLTQAQSYVLTVATVDPAQGIRPGVYQGSLRLEQVGTGTAVAPDISVTVNVRESLAVAFAFAVLGLIANWIVGRARITSKAYPYLRRYRRLKSDLGKLPQKERPLLLDHLFDWIGRDLWLPVDGGGVNCATQEMDVAEALLLSEENLAWAEELNVLTFDAQWDAVRTAILSMQPGDGIAQLQAAIAAKLGVPSAPAGQPATGGQSAAQTGTKAHATHKKAEARQKPWQRKVRHLFLRGGLRALLAHWIFDGAVELSLMAMKALVFCTVVGVTLQATAAEYQQHPAFGSEPWKDFALVFGIGFAGKAATNLVQKLVPGSSTGISDLSDLYTATPGQSATPYVPAPSVPTVSNPPVVRPTAPIAPVQTAPSQPLAEAAASELPPEAPAVENQPNG